MTRCGRPRFAAGKAARAILAATTALALGAWGTAGTGSAWGAAVSPQAAASGTWGKAISLSAAPGVAGFGISAITCTSPGNCVAAGPFSGNGIEVAFVVSQVHGVWGKAQPIRGLATRTGFKSVGYVTALACPSAGNCVAVGSYRARSLHRQAFIVTQRHGTWGTAFAVPGLASLNKKDAGLGGLSCPLAGDCGATGSYMTKSGQSVPFVVNDANGVWGHPLAIPGVADLPGAVPGRGLGAGPIACATPGYCSIAGTYPVGDGATQAFVVSELHGTLASAQPVPHLAALNQGQAGGIGSIFCSSSEDCAAVGTYTRTDGATEVFAVSEDGGAWGKAINLPGLIKLNSGGMAQVSTLSCVTSDNCVAGGSYTGSPGSGFSASHGFLVSEVRGVWRRATLVPGLAGLDQGDQSAVLSISCTSVGNCGAAGDYTPAWPNGLAVTEPFVVSQVHGAWGQAVELPGIGKLNTAGDAQVNAISCAAASRCGAGGFYVSKKAGFQTFVDTQS